MAWLQRYISGFWAGQTCSLCILVSLDRLGLFFAEIGLFLPPCDGSASLSYVLDELGEGGNGPTVTVLQIKI